MSQCEGTPPDFIIGGAPRSGTTSLAQALDRHPAITMAKPLIPEPKVFMFEAEGGPAEYLERYAACFSEGKAGLRGEKTSYYFENEDALRRMRETFSSMCYIFIVREPVSRAYSNYLWSRQNGYETLSFEQAVAQESGRVSPLSGEKAYVRPFDYLARGDYATFAQRYIDVFGREALGFFLYERLQTEPGELLLSVQRFLGVEPIDLESHVHFSTNLTDRTAAPLDRRLERFLRERMQGSVLRFAQVTGVDVGPWGY